MGQGHRQFTEQEINKHIKRYSDSPWNLSWKCNHNKTDLIYQIYKNWKVTISSAGEDVDQKAHSYTAGRNVNWYNHFREQLNAIQITAMSFNPFWYIHVAETKISWHNFYPFYMRCLVIIFFSTFSTLCYFILPTLSYFILFYFN